MDLYAYLGSECSHTEPNFKYLRAMAGPPNVVGPRKTPPFPSLDGPDDFQQISSIGNNRHVHVVETTE